MNIGNYKFNLKIKRTLKFEFAILTGVLMGTIILSMAIYIHYFIMNLSGNVSLSAQANNEAVASTVYELIVPEIKKGTSNNIIRSKLVNLLKNNLMVYVIIRDCDKQINTFSSLRDLENTDLRPDDKSIRQYLSTINSYLLMDNKETYSIIKNYDRYKIFIGFNKDPKAIELLNSFKRYMSGLVAFFVITGLVLASIMSKIVINPINTLIDSSTRLAEGDLSHRIEDSEYIEINRLIASYNMMASNLEKVYTYLENTVENRTLALNKTLEELKQTQAMMVHSEKMKSLGELVAGITHEINNPINFIYGNLIYLKQYTQQLFSLINLYANYENELSEEHKNKIKEYKDEIDIEFLKTDLPDLLKSCEEGTTRTKNIVMDLKNFSRMDESVFSNINLPKELDTTLNILHNKYKDRIEIHKEYEENFPKIEAYGGQLNQVLMNIIDNAIGAIEGKGNIWIRLKTNKQLNKVFIEIEDDGCGMTEETKEKIFNPFYTTKPVGKGTGLGMSISYKVIENHKGKISLESIYQKGSKFIIELPITHTKVQTVTN